MVMITVSIIIPVYNEERSLAKNIRVILDYTEKINESFEVVLIDDGSRDNSWLIIKELSKTNTSVHGIRFSRNFGKEAAMFAGLKKAKGQAVIVMDSDLQHPPSLIKQMILEWTTKKYSVVEAIKETRSDSVFYLKIANAYNVFFKQMTGLNMKNSSDFKLLDRVVVDNLLEMNEIATFFRGMVSWIGYPTKIIYFDVPKRIGDESKFSFYSLSKLAITSLMTFSSAPLHLITLMGVVFLVLSSIGTVVTLLKYFSGQSLEGFSTIILLILFTGSLLMIGLGIIGTYISKIFDEVKGRPKYIVEKKTEIK